MSPNTASPGGCAGQPVGRPRMYTAELDGETCPACQAFAGLEYAPDDPGAPSIPNPACTCARGCRCLWLWL